ncbi:MAG TPA: DUF3426 domain-containing protein [Rhodocyclaceae bacterium]|nr:DUF3426 domain-containing protein [Rhodocyclaceae bacterium]
MMHTRCPNCGTTFRVTPEQLKAKQGKVRCGQCQQVFDALRTLAEEAAIAQPRAAEAEAIAPRAPEPEARHERDLAAGESHTELPASEAATGFRPVGEHEATAEPAPAAPAASEFGLVLPTGLPVEMPLPESRVEPALVQEPEAPIEAAPSPVAATEPIAGLAFHFPSLTESQFEPQPVLELHDTHPPARRWPWVLGSMLALLILTAQVLLHYRVELVATAPNLRSPFVAACDLLGCQIPLPHKIELIGIESSDLAPDGATAGKLHLTATLRNRAPFVQAWPNLEITLTDAQERPLLRRALAPEEYLPPSAVAAGFARRGEQSVQLSLQTADVPAVGYRLYVFYP